MGTEEVSGEEFNCYVVNACSAQHSSAESKTNNCFRSINQLPGQTPLKKLKVDDSFELVVEIDRT